ncbi:TM0106 family RecB-like putative nuclease [Corynebacterium sp. 35RC1]|nr:TM0106 family RecB-like putative nuclease [Corynebacterium sp. 35RC1]
MEQQPISAASIDPFTPAIIQPADLVGCQYRRVQQSRFPDTSPTEQSALRKLRLATAREEVLATLPTAPAKGDRRNFLRIDLAGSDTEDEREFATLEALAARANIVTSAVLRASIGDPGSEGSVLVALDALIRRADGTYMPLLVSNHRVARPATDTRRQVRVVDTSRLGLGAGYTVGARLKHHSIDSFTLAAAARALEELGLGSRRGALIGQNRAQAYILNTDLLQPGLDAALRIPAATQARRIKECVGCRFWRHCQQELQARDDLSLFLPGDRGQAFREQGIETVQGLIDARLGPPSLLAAAWRAGIPVLKTADEVQFPRFDVEIDVDVEAYLDQGAYLWGTFDGRSYRPFVTWGGLGQAEEARNFANFWAWLVQQRRAAAQASKSLGVFCYSAHGENHWLKFSARRFHGKYPDVPSVEEVTEFISSPQWIDVFASVKAQLVGPEGIGLKVVAPQAGYHWAQDNVDGEASVALYLEAIGQVEGADPQAARDTLLSYNGDDCQATAAVRKWLAAGAPGAPKLG